MAHLVDQKDQIGDIHRSLLQSYTLLSVSFLLLLTSITHLCFSEEGISYRRNRAVVSGCRLLEPLGEMMTQLVGPCLHFCISLYGESQIIARAIASPTLPDTTPMHKVEKLQPQYCTIPGNTCVHIWDGIVPRFGIWAFPLDKCFFIYIHGLSQSSFSIYSE